MYRDSCAGGDSCLAEWNSRQGQCGPAPRLTPHVHARILPPRILDNAIAFLFNEKWRKSKRRVGFVPHTRMRCPPPAKADTAP